MNRMKAAGLWLAAHLIGWLARAVEDSEVEVTNLYYGDDDGGAS